MLKTIIVLGVLLCSLHNVYGQEEGPKNSIKVYPTSLLLGRANLITFERKFAQNHTGSLGFGINTIGFGVGSFFSVGGQLEYKYYFNEAPKGWYAGALLSFTGGSLTTDINPSSGFSTTTQKEYPLTIFIMGAKGGYQFLWKAGKGNFTLDFGAGLGYVKATADGGIFATSASGVGWILDMGLGYSF